MASALARIRHLSLTTSRFCSSQEIPKGPLLRRLYCLLLQLSLDSSFHQYKFRDTFSMDVWNNWFEIELRFEDMTRLSDMLFSEVHRQFELLVSGIGLLPVAISSSQNDENSNMLVAPEDLSLLLRCCMAILQLLEFDQSLVLDKCQILLKILKKLCSLDLIFHFTSHMVRSERSIFSFKKSVSHKSKYTPDGAVSCIREELDASICFSERGGSPVTLFCSILEVFADEILVHHRLRDHFVETNRASCIEERPFICEGGHSDIMHELISAHFLLSVSDEWGMIRFPETLFWSYGKNFKIPQLSITAAMAMLGSSALYTAPEGLQAHVISLVSECIGVQMPSHNMKLNSLLLNNYILAFEQSVNLYTSHTLSLRMGSWVLNPIKLDSGSSSTFKSYVQPETYDKIYGQLSKLVDPCHPCFHYLFTRAKSDLLNASMEYINENIGIIDKSYRDEACLILSCMIEMILHGGMGVQVSRQQGETNLQELYLLAAGLKLMSCSLLQVVWFMRGYDKMGCLKTLQDSSQCQEYDLITAIINCFGQYSVTQPIQKILLDVMGTCPMRHKDTKLALVHFVGLLSFSFDIGLDFLWKGSIFVMLVLVNLLIFEEGNLDALLALLHCKEKSFFSQSSAKVSQAVDYQSSSHIVASNFVKIQTLHFQERNFSAYNTNGLATHPMSLVEKPDDQVKYIKNALHCEDAKDDCKAEDNDTCSGHVFLQYMGIPSDAIDDLAEFVVCKSGKDYSNWMKQRVKYRKWKCEKLRVARQHERRTKILDYIKDIGSRLRHRK